MKVTLNKPNQIHSRLLSIWWKCWYFSASFAVHILVIPLWILAQCTFGYNKNYIEKSEDYFPPPSLLLILYLILSSALCIFLSFSMHPTIYPFLMHLAFSPYVSLSHSLKTSKNVSSDRFLNAFYINILFFFCRVLCAPALPHFFLCPVLCPPTLILHDYKENI